MVTIRDVAARAGVSPSTVSHTFNGKRTISGETRDRVLQAASELNYVPNAAAQSLKTKRNNMIAVFAHSPASLVEETFQRFVAGLTQEADASHNNRVILLTRRNAPNAHPNTSSLFAAPVDGIVLRDPAIDDTLLAELLESNKPFVVVGRPANSAIRFYVDNDNLAIARIAVSYLAKHGHRHIAFINGPTGLTVSGDRMDGYRLELENLGLHYNPDLVRCADFTQEGGYAAVSSLLDSSVTFNAIWAANDLLAIGAMKALRARGFNVPTDVSVVGVNNDLVAQACEPGLTTIDINSDQLGAATAHMLAELIETGTCAVSPIVVPGVLVERESTRCL